MRVKKAKKPPRSIRYLLYADRRLQRISLRKISERLKQAKQPPRSVRLKPSAGATSSMRFPWGMSSRAIVLGVMFIVAAAALITARQPSHRADVAHVDALPEANPPLENVPTAAQLETKKTVVSKPPATAAAAKTDAVDLSIRKTLAVESAPKAAAVESTARADVQNVPPVTITGCLELDKVTFWLKDTTGVDAPKSRSWRSGFLKKRSSQIELVDATNTLQLPNHVGQRVAATGTLMNREMWARSLRQVAASCN